MSRFGLRSNSEISKLPNEEEDNRRTGRTAKVPLKRVSQKKKHLIGNEPMQEKEKNDSSVSIMCSLPLSRLSGILEKLKVTKENLGVSVQSNGETLVKCEKEKANAAQTGSTEYIYYSTKEDDDGSSHVNYNESHLSQKQPIRILCLYCDKKFASFKMQSNHVEKFHIQQKNRRCSGRNSQIVPTVGFKKRNEAVGMIMFDKYPGCSYCKRSKTNQMIASAKDLSGLFLHLIDFHADKYFGCKECVQRFQNISKLSKHMQTVHKSETLPPEGNEKVTSDAKPTEQIDVPKYPAEKSKVTKTRSVKFQKSSHPAITSIEISNPLNSTTVIGGEEPILSRLGLTQNRLPNNRKCVRVRKENILSEVILKSDQPSVYMSAVKARNKSGKNVVRECGDAEVVFRMPSRTEILSCVFDDNFYREVVSNVRHNLLYHLDGKLKNKTASAINITKASAILRHQLPAIRSTLVESPVVLSGTGTLDSEIHAATSLTATTAFPTLLTAEQYGGDIISSKIRRPHTKNSWKWKWDSVKKFKIINEGGKIIKKVKQPTLGLRDLSKLDMWTQLIMRQNHETHQQRIGPELSNSELFSREEKQRVNEQLNVILDMRLLPHIILEQNEQAVIKFESENFEFASFLQSSDGDNTDNILGHSFIDECFLSVLKLLPNYEYRCSRRQLVLSGEWARPRCYLCMCCGAKFEKLKSLEEHKMFRHSHVLCTHYEVVGRELLAGNSIRHLFIPNRALSYYGNEGYNFSSFTRKFNWDKDETIDLSRSRLATGSTGEDDSSDSVQSTLNSCTMNTYSIKNSTDECDTDTKNTLDINTNSPSHSMQSSNSSFTLPMKMHLKTKEMGSSPTKCSKCSRKCNGILDLYRHMLDCSGDYIWSLAKKRKYRYYCGSKKRRPWNKHNFTDLRKNKPKCLKTSLPANDTEESVSSSTKIKTPPRQRPSDAESIKKMLENLPPKRICKTIFPPLPKAKKSKFLAKHKMFNTQGRLRKTRARQISVLSKSKGQYSNNVTRSKSKILHHTNKKIGKINTSEQKKLIKKHQQSEPAVSKMSSLENFQKLKSSKDSLSLIDDSNEKLMSNAITDFNKEFLVNSDAMNCTKITKNSSKSMIELESGNTEKERFSGQLFEKDVQNVDSHTHIQESLSNRNSEVKSNSSQDNINCIKKRSKKISDCIAMLTGKLEEKLKTERNVSKRDNAYAGPEKSDVVNNICVNELKTPKRKTVSRRIIKVDNVGINDSLLIPETIQNITNISNISNDLNALEPSQSTSTLITKETERIVVEANISSVPPSFGIASPVSGKVFAKHSAFIPVNKIGTMDPCSEPLSGPALKILTPVQSVRVNMSLIPPQISVLPPQPLMQTVSVAPVIIPVAPVVVPVAPMAPIVSVAPLLNTEPLNLSNSKNIKKHNTSHDLSCSASFRNGIPARRQTICGFEARNIFLDDEPLDLSQKSKKELPHYKAADIHPVMPFFKPIVPPVVNISMPPPQTINLNKQFYSNLELLRIPQVRNPINKKCSELVNQIPKNVIKKRGVTKSNMEKNVQLVTTLTGAKTQNKESPLQKKEHLNKLKCAQKMDDEVINHIDDAINSVINAVKASLPDGEEEGQAVKDNSQNLEHSKPISPSIEKPSKPQECNEETTKEELPTVQKLLRPFPQKRCVRSKTLDCRPTALNVVDTFSTDLLQNQVPLPHISESNVYAQSESTITTSEVVSSTEVYNDNNICENPVKSIQINCEENKTSLKSRDQQLIPNEKIGLSLIDEGKSKENSLSEIEKETPVAKVSDEVGDNLVNEENISNINNTSSGFHSSGQTETTVGAKKKQRRRRKNELAAIVADQLLESFKIDKTRRDNLKKLENLAYEKSEDLLLTGMLLMSSTKRNVTSSFKRDFQDTDDVFNKSSDYNIKRQKQSTARTAKSNNIEPKISSNKLATKPANEERNVTNFYPIEKEVNPKRNRRRSYRSKGKAFDNENISKLKSSLESFSIGIEKQLSELEARNSNIFNFSDKKSYCASSVSTRSSLLKPSILCTNPEPINEDKQITEGKSAISSRDPRLNKNIHKNENEASGISKPVVSLENNADVEDDNYLTEIAKNVNEKIMSAENEEFAFGNDSFVMANELQDDSNSKCFSRPPTSMSVRSAPSFNDDRSNFGSLCDENTNTEIMDMDLEDELSVYTSYSQDIGRNRGRRRRRRRSILLKRRPKKHINRETCTEKFECTLCKKTFFTVNSLTKHNMTLAHVSNVSAQEYLLSKALQSSPVHKDNNKETQTVEKCTNNVVKGKGQVSHIDLQSVIESRQNLDKNTTISEKLEHCNKDKNSYNNSSRLTLNPDERLFFECCNILKGTETASMNNDECNNSGVYTFYGNKTQQAGINTIPKPAKSDVLLPRKQITLTSSCQNGEQNMFRSPPVIHSNNKNIAPVIGPQNQHLSPNYSAVSQFSVVTNTTSRFKTKAAMKGYENVNVDLTVYQETTKTRAICKLTELAEIALGNEKTNSPELVISSNHNNGTVIKPLTDREYVTVSAIDHQKGYTAQTNRVKNNETQSSTSSKTIMHSSIIKAAVEEHNKMSCGRIIIPDRPFKNIGLEEKETITFQKPKTTVNLLTDDNTVSTTSYSDRDDFDFASISCEEESIAKTSNERLLENNSDSSSSRATAKTFENKSLIMGRIFKNASTKAKTSINMQNITAQNDPQPKTDMNQLFDELRGDGVAKSNTTESALKKQSADSLKNLQNNQSNVVVERKNPRSSKEIRKKSNTSTKTHKDISRLESELGMSQEEIVKLINEGQRKSKRRCATNQQKKLVEMWSSDEYEEFLSTKDIIALIEEKEKEETRRKRRNSVNQMKTIDNKNKVIGTNQTIAEKNIPNLNYIERTANISKKHQKSENRNEAKTTVTAEVIKNMSSIHSVGSKGKYTRRSTTTECVIKLNNDVNNKAKNNDINNRLNNKKRTLSKVSKAARTEAVEAQKVVKLDNDILKASNLKKCQNFTKNIKTSQDGDNGYLSEVKRNSPRAGSGNERKYSKCREIVYNLKAFNKKSGATNIVNKKNNNVNNVNNNNNNNNNNSNNNNQSYKKKLKIPPNLSPPRRKRLASEKLYYWSSSSDEDFGKINSTCAQEFDGGEQYQKHGWIVGDSHKKLVTLLAIAKGSKKVDNCGVKKKICKKKN